jgi:hypothetical protein
MGPGSPCWNPDTAKWISFYAAGVKSRSRDQPLSRADEIDPPEEGGDDPKTDKRIPGGD